MATLHSYSFGNYNGVSELPDEVLGLFTSLVVNPEKQIEFASEIISSGLQGNIDFSKEFSIDGFEAAIRKNERLAQDAHKKKESFIDFSSSKDDWDDVMASGGIKVDSLNNMTVEKMKDAYEEIVMEDELRYAVETIKSLNSELIIEEHVNFIFALKQAVKGIPSAVENVKRVCESYEVIGELVHEILESGEELNQLFA